MRTYYRGPDVVVTSAVFACRAIAQTYAIRELRDVHITRAERFEPSVAYAAAGLVFLGAAASPPWHASPLYALGLVAVGMPALAAGAVLWRLRPQVWELRATYRGAVVTLFSSSHERVFNQVTRGLRRAIEDSRPIPLWAPPQVA